MEITPEEFIHGLTAIPPPDAATPCQLTTEQIKRGWRFSKNFSAGKVSVIAYHNPKGLLSDPAPGVPSYQAWHKDGKPRALMHHKNGDTHSPNKATPAVIFWYPNGAITFVGFRRKGNDYGFNKHVPCSIAWDENGIMRDVCFRRGHRLIPRKKAPIIARMVWEGK